MSPNRRQSTASTQKSMNSGASLSRIFWNRLVVHPARWQMALKIHSYAPKYSSSRASISSPNAALDQIHSPTILGHTSAIASLIFHPMRDPKYINSENVWAGIPARSSVGFNNANWKEGNRAESVGMLISATGFMTKFVQYSRSRFHIPVFSSRFTV